MIAWVMAHPSKLALQYSNKYQRMMPFGHVQTLKVAGTTVLVCSISTSSDIWAWKLTWSRGSPLKVFSNVMWNLLDSWLDSKIPEFILEIPVHQIRKAYVTWLVIYVQWQLTTVDSKILGNLAICIS